MRNVFSCPYKFFYRCNIYYKLVFSFIHPVKRELEKQTKGFVLHRTRKSLEKKFDTWLSQLHVILWNIFLFIFPERPDTLKTFSIQHYITLCHIIQIVKAFSIFKGYDLRTIFCDVYSHVVWLRNRRKWCLLFLSLF